MRNACDLYAKALCATTCSMKRHQETNALILTLKQTGENNRLVTFFTVDGVKTALLYGGAKSKMRSLVSPFHTGRMWLYASTGANYSASASNADLFMGKISDFDVTSCRPSLRENLYKNWAASLACELVLKTHARGHELFVLVNGFLDGLELCTEKECRLGTVRFLWRYLHNMGVMPDASECAQCGKPFAQSAYYLESENGFVCKDCLFCVDENHGKAIILSKEALDYLNAISVQSPSEVRRYTIQAQTFSELQNLLFFLTSKSCDYRLKTLENSVLL